MTTLKRVRGFTDSEPDKEPNNGSSNGLVNNYRKRVDLTKLNLSDDKLFSLLMGYDDFCKTVLEIVLGIELESIEHVEVQQTYQNLIFYIFRKSHMRYPIPRFVSMKSVTPMSASFPLSLVTFTLNVLSSMKTSLSHRYSIISSLGTISPFF